MQTESGSFARSLLTQVCFALPTKVSGLGISIADRRIVRRKAAKSYIVVHLLLLPRVTCQSLMSRAKISLRGLKTSALSLYVLDMSFGFNNASSGPNFAMKKLCGIGKISSAGWPAKLSELA